MQAFPQRLLLILGLFLLGACGDNQTEEAHYVRSIKTFTVADIANGRLRNYSGVIEAADSSPLSFPVNGTVQTINAKVGDRVNKGEVLASLDKSPFLLDVQAAEAELARARADYQNAQQQMERQQTLFEGGWVSEAALDQAINAEASARSGVEYASSRLGLARRNLANADIIAPFDGVVSDRNVEPFTEVGAGQVIFELFAEGAMEVLIDIPETEINFFTQGMRAEVNFPNNPCRCQGRVSEIGSATESANAFRVKISLLDQPQGLRPGMTANTTLTIGDGTFATGYLVPLSALVFGNQPNEAFVFKFNPKTSTVQKVPVRGEGANLDMIVIFEGVGPGDILASAGTSFLEDGQEVTLLNPTNQ